MTTAHTTPGGITYHVPVPEQNGFAMQPMQREPDQLATVLDHAVHRHRSRQRGQRRHELLWSVADRDAELGAIGREQLDESEPLVEGVDDRRRGWVVRRGVQ